MRAAMTFASILCVLGLAREARAQHQHGALEDDGELGAGPPDRPDAEPAHSGPLGIPMPRDGSGTAWQPDESSVHAVHARAGGWTFMVHGLFFAGYNVQGSERGDEQFFSPNWVMGMASHSLGTGQLMLRGMFSLDAVTMGEEGYPLLLQSGEAVDGEPLVDRQHPHDLFMELAGTYAVPVSSGVAVQVYGGPAGEPALGPVAFPHRRSAAPDPLAGLGHHWQDSTHIAFGVATVGVMTRVAKLEGSWFNGREPDQDRYDLDLRGFDSYSTRLSVNPHPSWSTQVSYGWLESPEELEPDVSVQRVTASAMYVGRHAPVDEVATTAVWGRNIPSHGPATDAVLVENSLDLGAIGTFFQRGEVARKAGHDLGLPLGMEEEVFPVGSAVLGYVYDLDPVASLVPGIGVRGSVNFIGDDLAAFYGTSTPAGVMVFARLEPDAVGGGEHAGHGEH